MYFSYIILGNSHNNIVKRCQRFPQFVDEEAEVWRRKRLAPICNVLGFEVQTFELLCGLSNLSISFPLQMLKR